MAIESKEKYNVELKNTPQNVLDKYASINA